MSTLHPNFPFSKGMWLWNLSQCEGGNVDAIIDKCKRYNISYVLVKSGDGRNTWGQFTKDLVDKFHAAGLKIYSWTYNYGLDPVREANIAMWAIDMGVDGHVFDAEAEFRDLPDPVSAATILLSSVRQHAPNVFLAYSPLVFPENHPNFPYDVFGKYCDAVMPQAYWGTIYKQTVNDKASVMVADMYTSWAAWETKMKSANKADSIKPMIPAGQGYDNPQTNYVLTPTDIKAFADAAFNYMSINFWSFQHMLRNDCWEMVRDVAVKAPPAPTITASEQPAQVAQQPAEQPTQAATTPTETPATQTSESPLDSAIPSVPQGATALDTNGTTTPIKPNDTTPLSPNSTVTIPVPVGQSTTVTLSQKPDGTTVSKVTYSRKHIDILMSIINWILRLLHLKGGD